MDDRQKFEKAYEEYADSIFRYLFLKTRDRQRAVDLTQDTYIQTWEYMAKGNEIREMRPFLYRVAHNSWVKSLRHLSKQISLDELSDAGWQPADDYDIEKEAAEIEQQGFVMKRLDELDDIYKEVLLLRFVEGLKVGEIAALLGETENVISVRIHRARAKLKTLYDDHGT